MIEPNSGSLRVGNFELMPFEMKSSVLAKVEKFVGGSRDYENGYEWFYLKGLTFAGQDAALSICFYNEQFTEASWSVQLPGASMEGSWPMQAAIDNEIEFVRDTLSNDFGCTHHDGNFLFHWGDVWSGFDAKGYLASNGIRFSAQ